MEEQGEGEGEGEGRTVINTFAPLDQPCASNVGTKLAIDNSQRHGRSIEPDYDHHNDSGSGPGSGPGSNLGH